MHPYIRAMKLMKGFLIFCFFSIALGSCFDPPETPVEPEIEFNDVTFIDVPGTTTPDSLVIAIKFKDGDGDLGLTETQTNAPYHPVNFYLEDGTGTLTPIATTKKESKLPDFVYTEGKSGKLVTLRTRKKTGYTSLPRYNANNSANGECVNYQVGKVYVGEEDKRIFDKSYHITDTIKLSAQSSVYVLTDTFYIQENPNHYNIEVDFFQKKPGDPKADADGFVELNWKADYCQSFDGRFPVLSESTTPLDGTLRYSMNSIGFKTIFNVGTLKLRIKIRDRALHESNPVERTFTIPEITKKG